MTRRVLLGLLVLFVLGASVAAAEPFVNPPESSALLPPGGWVTPFPYQRNALIDFATDPATWSDDPGGVGKDLQPGANYDLEGYDDPTLYDSDWFDWEGDLDWVDTDARFPGRQGLIGINSRGDSSLDIWWHLDNWPEPRPEKHVWIEMDIYWADGSWVGWDEPAPGSAWLWGGTQGFEDLGGGWYRFNAWNLLVPNPEWENLHWLLYTNPGATGSVLIDNWHIATECPGEPTVPELPPFALAALGLLPLGLKLRRKK